MPSVNASSFKVKLTEAVPLIIVKLPVNEPEVKSLDVIPVPVIV